MIQRILTAVCLIGLVFASVAFFPGPVFLLLGSLLLVLSLKEFRNLAKGFGLSLFSPTLCLVPALPWIWVYLPVWIPAFLVFSVLLLLFWSVLKHENLPTSLPSIASSVFLLLYLGVPIAILCSYHPSYAGELSTLPWELGVILLTVWLSDSGAYFVGKAFGRHKVTPRISPNKSLEGFLAGFLVPVLVVPFIAMYLVPGRSFLFFVVAVSVTTAASIFGDLFESQLKRGAGTKDSSHLLPGHGGILDRIDSLLTAVPAYHLVVILQAKLAILIF